MQKCQQMQKEAGFTDDVNVVDDNPGNEDEGDEDKEEAQVKRADLGSAWPPARISALPLTAV